MRQTGKKREVLEAFLTEMPNCQIVNQEAAPWWFHIKRRHPFVTLWRLLVIFTSIRAVWYGQVGLRLSTFNFPFIYCDCFIYLSFLVVFKDMFQGYFFLSLTLSWSVIPKLRVEKSSKKKGKEAKKSNVSTASGDKRRNIFNLGRPLISGYTGQLC